MVRVITGPQLLLVSLLLYYVSKPFLVVRMSSSSDEDGFVTVSTPLLASTSIGHRRPPDNDLDNDPSSEGKKKVALKRELGFFSSTAMLFNIFLGSGIFFAPNNILQHSGSFGFSMCLWVVGAVIALSGALCYLELGLMVKKSGSTYVFIKEAFSFGRSKPWMEQFGCLCGFVVAWISVVILQPLGHAIILVALGSYMCRPFFITCDYLPEYAVKFLALFVSSEYCCSVTRLKKVHVVCGANCWDRETATICITEVSRVSKYCGWVLGMGGVCEGWGGCVRGGVWV